MGKSLRNPDAEKLETRADSQWLFMTLPQFCWPTTPKKIIKPILGNMPKQDKWSPTSDHHQHHQQASNPSSYPIFHHPSHLINKGDDWGSPMAPLWRHRNDHQQHCGHDLQRSWDVSDHPNFWEVQNPRCWDVATGSPRYNQTLVLTRESHRKPRKKTQENGESSKNLWSGFNYST